MTESVVAELPIFHVQKNQSPSASTPASAKLTRPCSVSSDESLAPLARVNTDAVDVGTIVIEREIHAFDPDQVIRPAPIEDWRP